MVFEEVRTDEWKYAEIGDSIDGVLINKKFGVGENKANLYLIECSPGEFVNVWGSAILNSRMELVNIGDKIKIIYKGLGEAKDDQNAPKIFQVLVDR